ncbi:unnamed protein product, partial [marine sediment metagenome]
ASEAELNVHTSAVHAEELIYANWLRTGGTGSIEYWRSIGSPLYYTPPPVYTCTYCGATFASEAELNVHTSAVHAEELIYANWLRTGGTGSIEYWRSIGSPLYYTPPPVYTCPYCGATFASESELNVHTSAVHAEELIYANWLRTGGTGSIEYWRSIGSPLYYTPH